MTGDKKGGFEAVVVCHCEDAVEAVRGRELDNEVHGDGFKGEGSVCNGDGIMGNVRSSSELFGGLAGGAAADEGRDEVLHMGPPVVFCKEVASFEDAGVTGCWRVMV